NQPAQATPERAKGIIALFAQKVFEKSPYEVVYWDSLNRAALGHAGIQKYDPDEDECGAAVDGRESPSITQPDVEPSAASPVLRKILSVLNDFARVYLGVPPDGDSWFVSVKGEGA